MSYLSIRDLDLQGKRVFIRVDFNVPLQKNERGGERQARKFLEVPVPASARPSIICRALAPAIHFYLPWPRLPAKSLSS
jgi:hypothetical protein